jgi:dTDP-4-dehydrorhamnose 3,5-epimerase
MKFRALELAGAYLIAPERVEDERGYFMRTWCRDEFQRNIGDTTFVQSSQSFNRKAGTLRGLHFQAAPHGETKLVRCARGAIFDVIADLRPDSPTYGRWLGCELSGENGHALFIPDGFAHGFQTLEDESEVLYQISSFYNADAARGIRWNDRTLNIRWPLPVGTMSARDREWPDLATARAA